jgi:hypothetical protein
VVLFDELDVGVALGLVVELVTDDADGDDGLGTAEKGFEVALVGVEAEVADKGGKGRVVGDRDLFASGSQAVGASSIACMR